MVPGCMKSGSERVQPVVDHRPGAIREPKFLVELEPWHRNLTSLLRAHSREPLQLSSSPAEFWPDVFVASGLPWRRFLDSALSHLMVIAAVWGALQLGWGKPRVVPPIPFNRADVIYYPESEYLPPLNSRRQISYTPRKGEPEFAKQDIISVPPDADNTHQTIVTPPQIKIDHDVPMPNIVAWSPTRVAVPMAATERSTADMKLPELPTSVVAPPPEVEVDSSLRAVEAPQAGIIKPPPSVQMASIRTLGDLDIGHSDVVAPAPQLPMEEQHRLGAMANSSLAGSPAVVPPPPSVRGSRDLRGGGQLIALSVRPAPVASQLPAGNRRGTFAATPQGRAGAPGTPDAASGSDSGDGGSNAKSGDAPSGLYVGRGADSSGVAGNRADNGSDRDTSGDSRLLASAKPPRVSSSPHQAATEVSPGKVSDDERKVFGDRKFYAMSLNMPNLNSAGGSWVIHFAELKEDSQKGELSAPVALQKVDPAYPTELMRENVAGTVTLSAVIRSDGSVEGVRILSSGDDRLDQYARAAVARWRFRPATKNGNPVDLQAVIMIPFRPLRWKNGF